MRAALAAFLYILILAGNIYAGPVEDEDLYNAANKLDIDAVNSALEAGANPNAYDPKLPKRYTPLDAVGSGMLGYKGEDKYEKAVKIAERLFERGAKLNQYANTDITYFSISEGNVPLVGLLLDHGMSPIAPMEGYSPPELAIMYGQTGVYNLLIHRGGIPVKPEDAAQIIFVEAAMNGMIGLMETVAKRGAMVDVTDPCGKTALINAVHWPIYRQQQVESIEWLLKHDANPNLEAKSGPGKYTSDLPLHHFIKANTYTLNDKNTRPEAKKLAEMAMSRLIKAGAKISGINSRGMTPLHVAASYDNFRAAEILLREGARVMAKDDRGKTPLDYAESAKMIKLLKKNGAKEK